MTGITAVVASHHVFPQAIRNKMLIAEAVPPAEFRYSHFPALTSKAPGVARRTIHEQGSFV